MCSPGTPVLSNNDILGEWRIPERNKKLEIRRAKK
jgi:hypothetical protein